MLNTQENCLVRIRSFYPKFSDKERKIADYILKNPKKIIHSTINQVAEDLNIADSTVFRFCKRIGFNGYQSLKIALASEVVEPIQDIHERIGSEDTERTVTEKIFRSNMKTLEDTIKMVDESAIKKAVSAILGARRVEFFGSGGSAIVSFDAYHKFIRTGITAFAHQDSHMQLMSASQLTEDDVAILISHTGTTKDMIDILEVVRENGVKTIGLTSFAKSPLSRGVDVVLYAVSEETDYRSEALSSRIAQLSMIDALYVNVMVAKKEEGKKALQKVRKAIAAKRI
ncbi:MurR/RpiR family transcriptional regulator [Metabacillus arenae]|uniref:MurR/RpiR family transcriptional regulator n=1 Tax=Metabacillus arenae TaxID=2771434 RepID=A0A926S221_9BACI|nr:MurR/RpiR family transcriptional regulator [Metabacillus arenae]MBD1381559.1 MurR/RpiR family transcriptional regulator [Metabacillus arenae]